jgi:hypothetical protein
MMGSHPNNRVKNEILEAADNTNSRIQEVCILVFERHRQMTLASEAYSMCYQFLYSSY